jgi:hypothetical protein
VCGGDLYVKSGSHKTLLDLRKRRGEAVSINAACEVCATVAEITAPAFGAIEGAVGNG